MSNIKKIKIIEIISKITKINSNLIDETSSIDDVSKRDSIDHLKIMLEIENN